jgi:hypothetical protein
MKVGGRSEIVEKNKVVEKGREKRCVEYLTIGCEVVVAFIIIFEMCRRENVQ